MYTGARYTLYTPCPLARAVVALLGWYAIFYTNWEEMGAVGRSLIVVNPNTYWYEGN